MVNGDATNVALQIAQELYSDGMQKNFFFPSYLTLYLVLQSSKVFQASFASSYVYARKKKLYFPLVLQHTRTLR
jgi:hypothetical protein